MGKNESAGNLQAVYVSGNGKVEWLAKSSYDTDSNTLMFTTNHFSLFGVGYNAATEKFTDITNHWARDSIEFVVSLELLNGTSETAFSPNAAMTRAMFVTALYRLAGSPSLEDEISGYPFADVDAAAYYGDAVYWARLNKIVQGVTDERFAPNNSITREQMAVIMANYAKAIGFELPKVHAENTFVDGANISSWAKDVVKQMQMASILAGKDGNRFDPQGTATRAEVSAVLKRFVELAINSDTAQGWMMNHSGKWMYYENGKPVTGKKKIDSTTYEFNQYGETTDLPKNLTYGTYTVQKGDSFWSIAKKYKCSMLELARINNKSIFSIIYAGEVLKVSGN